ncbi:hypothetical protein HIM_03213 [Hirsutella minnesotensis 3608]|nr:hypothetical protein HIM_03213 [Hirsutella minnesotensis 3608]
MTSTEKPREGSQARASGRPLDGHNDLAKQANMAAHAAAPALTESSRLGNLQSTDSASNPSDRSPRSVTAGSRFLRDPLGLPLSRSRSQSQSPFRLSMPSISPGQLAFSAMQYLPVPTLVLNNLKTVVLANEAMGKMMGIVGDDVDQDDAMMTLERMRGQTLSQVGIDMLQEGRPVWISWESFLDSLIQDVGARPPPAVRAAEAT